MRSLYSELRRLRSRKSTLIFFAASTCSAIFARRHDLDISPGQVPSLRDEPQMTSTREGEARLFCRFSAVASRSRVCFHSTGRSKFGSEKPLPAFTVRGDFRYSW